MVMWMTQFVFTVSSALPCSQIYLYSGNDIKQLTHISFRVSISIRSCRGCQTQFSLMSVDISELFEFHQNRELVWLALAAQCHPFCRKCFLPYPLHYFCLPDVQQVRLMKPSSDLHAISSLLYVTRVEIYLT